MSRSWRSIAAFAVVIGVVVGCGPSGPRPIVVKGKVTFKGEPVTQGMVQFTNTATYQAAETSLGAEGAYQLEVFAGSYTIIVYPPFSVDTSSGLPNPMFKKVANIPAKYHIPMTSGLKADVAADKATHDFELTP
jgi:hypothetical protein